ncbi:hypothetical protein Ddye_004834 [Dipteronia dyeriana]|uniref:Uncharacterized protein n=1 Tax=Dipteronia dyeriana TaxID=168575 RepID=A0AAE0CP49_9ROSI|nr:hypothetical protein Ddye_004834 [Dipteronia dyeriana]
MPVYGQQREQWRYATVYEGDRQRKRRHSRGPRKPKIDFLYFNSGDPHEWLDKVEHYFQILVKGWLEESLLGTFIEGLKPWLARGMKLKRPQRLTEAMRMAEILEDSYYSDKKPFKESSGSKNFKSRSNKYSWKGKGVIEDSSKKESKDVRKLINEEVQERIRKSLCFKC